MISCWMYDPKTAKREDKEKANELAEKARMTKQEADIFVQGFMAGLQYQQKKAKDNDTE